jgi:hypothetical protein
MKRLMLATLVVLVGVVGTVGVSSVSAKDAQAIRFVLAMNGEAVLDRETGLVWEKVPTSAYQASYNWIYAQYHCIKLTLGNRKGWRLPTIQELASLVDPSVGPPGPTIPSGSPFEHVLGTWYWSASTSADNPDDAWYVYFYDGSLDHWSKNSALISAWCVHGGQGVDPQ